MKSFAHPTFMLRKLHRTRTDNFLQLPNAWRQFYDRATPLDIIF